MDGRAAQEGRIPLPDKVGMLEPKKGAILQQPPEPPNVAVIVAEQHHHLQALDGLEELDVRCERARAPGGGAGRGCRVQRRQALQLRRVVGHPTLSRKMPRP